MLNDQAELTCYRLTEFTPRISWKHQVRTSLQEPHCDTESLFTDLKNYFIKLTVEAKKAINQQYNCIILVSND